jgi:BolA protein
VPCRVHIVSKEFEGKRLVQRHQMMYRLLDEEIKAGVHALSMDTKTPKEAGVEEQ